MQIIAQGVKKATKKVLAPQNLADNYTPPNDNGKCSGLSSSEIKKLKEKDKNAKCPKCGKLVSDHTLAL